MKAIVYVSEAIVEFNLDTLLDLALLASTNNSKLDVTGYLFFRKGKFTQYIEGKEEVVDVLFEKIKHDERHQILNYATEDIGLERRFPMWNMQSRFPDHFIPNLPKEAIVEIRLEQVLCGHLISKPILPQSLITWNKTIWRMMDTISRLQN